MIAKGKHLITTMILAMIPSLMVVCLTGVWGISVKRDERSVLSCFYYIIKVNNNGFTIEFTW